MEYRFKHYKNGSDIDFKKTKINYETIVVYNLKKYLLRN